MDQKQYWDEVSKTKQFTTPFQADEFMCLVDGDALIVDVGCGYGRVMEMLYDLGYRKMIGFDFSDEMIKRGKRQFSKLDLRVMKEERIPLDDESVDAVILFAVLTCIVDDSDQKKLIAEIRRILKPCGVSINDDDRNLERYERYKDVFGVYGAFELPEGAQVRHHSEEYIEELLSDFKKEAFEPLTFTTMNGNRSNGFYYFGRR